MANILGLLLEVKSNKFNYKFEGTFNLDLKQLLPNNILVCKSNINPSELLLPNNNSIILSKWQNEIPKSIIDINTTSFSLDSHPHFIYSPYFININPMSSKIIIGASIIILLSLLINGLIPLISYLFSICINCFRSYIKSRPERPSKRARTEEENYKYKKKELFSLTREDPQTSWDNLDLGSFGQGDDGDDDEDKNNRNRKNLIPGDKFIFNQITYLELQKLIDQLQELVRDLQSTRTLPDGTTELNWNNPAYVVNRAEHWYNIFIRIFDPIINQFPSSERTQHEPVVRTFARVRDTYYDFIRNVFQNLGSFTDVPSENLKFGESNPPTFPTGFEINHPTNYPSIYELWRPLKPCHMIYDINGKTLQRGIEVHSRIVDFYNAEFWEDWADNMIRLIAALQFGEINETNTPKFHPHFSWENEEWKKKYKPQYPKPPS